MEGEPFNLQSCSSINSVERGFWELVGVVTCRYPEEPAGRSHRARSTPSKHLKGCLHDYLGISSDTAIGGKSCATPPARVTSPGALSPPCSLSARRKWRKAPRRTVAFQ
ncbi:hypothetical protein Bbelb_436660 [Branchiostoma belcheri]|nr:hypothetical protein Bbelb_436660 [Branchiostoma belcheri]